MSIGIDMVEICEVADALERHGRHYLDRVYAQAEQAETAPMSPRRMREYLAGRFAAKEAVLKALRPPPSAAAALTQIVVTGVGGPPRVELTGNLLAWWRSSGHGPVEVSISHAGAAAVAVARTDEGPAGPRTDRDEQ
ncbi:holo-ACP synthase [Propionibacterium australiense]|uniref:Holo-[acyl-carrier-protein] synthase n=1 Tax=Propionibacterium australiense TaxID=119981 RepID=A0A383S4D0_9ACTN|nr:holo-ACP synthase [Propionibacterium australiense]RLP10650.1 4'-phosphopantetheinyl transferase superfamily protein [Propionibacterium australiense]RLP12945.1 4'-phosphopantetheinyl transferase superfamily protein [Propionibacterium australiense]SYZ32855.1 holo-[acyl-carrier-protein] synthase [Propionibacterium australiense]VEH91109.1 Holo-[acyl-carrier-protein] synthase [Propionibacterium australiense]